MNFFQPKSFYFELPIYTPTKIETPEDEAALEGLLEDTSSIDYYNPTLGENSTYNVKPLYNKHLSQFMEYGGMGFALLSCVRTHEQYYFFYYYDIESKVFMKVGQYPSIATFHISQVKKYNKILSKDKLREFTKAIGLAANGVGIGSFVYLRRIFEGLIAEARDKARAGQDWNEEAFSRSRMADRIELLRDYLPSFLVENKTLYGILSVGIHALTEEDCLAYFETVKVGIELILDEKLEAFQKQKKIEEARLKIASVNSKAQGK
jgi:hypothetical protein